MSSHCSLSLSHHCHCCCFCHHLVLISLLFLLFLFFVLVIVVLAVLVVEGLVVVFGVSVAGVLFLSMLPLLNGFFPLLPLFVKNKR